MHAFLVLALALSSTTAAATNSAQSSPAGASPPIAELDRVVLEELGSSEWSLERLVLPVPLGPIETQVGDELLVRVPGAGAHAGSEVDLFLSRHSVRAADAAVLVWAGERYWERAMPAARTYRGSIAGEPGSTVLASFSSEGLSARILSPNGDWSIVPLARLGLPGPRDAHVIFAEEAGRAMPAPCGVKLSAESTLDASPGPVTPVQPLASCQRLFEIAFDADFEYYQAFGSSVDNVIARIDEMLNEVDFFYARDVFVRFELTDYVIRTSPFYVPTSGGNLLDLFRAEWNSTLAGIPRDLAHLMTAKPGSIVEFGGLAWVGATCNVGLAYGWSMDGANIIGHEVGHNFGANHCHDATPCNNMCGACHYIAPVTKGVIQSYIAGQNCHERVGPHPTPLPPYSMPEGLSMRKDDLEALSSLATDVTRNDHDGNCTPVHVTSVESPSPMGATVSVLTGAGPEGRDLVVYEPPADVFVGTDDVAYTIQGVHAPAESANLPVEVRSLALAAYWSLDEGAGASADDLGAQAAHGTLIGDPVWTAGAFGNALEFDGDGDAVDITGLPLVADELTITAWVRRNGSQGALSGLAMYRGDGTAAGLRTGFGPGLSYQWTDSSGTIFWDSGFSMPDGAWVFIAVSVAPDSATVYLYDGALQSATNPVAHGPLVWDGSFQIAGDPASVNQYFAGAMDDVRVYDHALDAGAILDIAQQGGRAEIPNPADGGSLTEPSGALSWLAAPSASSHDVYFGTSYADVRDANTGSPEYQGNVLPTSFQPSAAAFDTTYFWRIDEKSGANTAKGQVWQYRLAHLDHWRLDETSGLVAANAAGGNAGFYVGGALLGEPGATPSTGTSVFLDGANDVVSIPQLDLHTDTLTITTWLRRNGPQTPWAGLVFSRGGTTTAGFNFGEADELRYHWDGGQWGWNSGLVPADNTWTFAALVIEPDRATIYMSVGDELVSATNTSGHGVEAFDSALLLGRDPTGGRYFDGWLDEVRVYPVALTKAQLEGFLE